MSFADQIEFLREIPPFDRLTAAELERVAGAMDIQYFQQDAVVAEADSPAERLLLVIKGLVREEAEGEAIDAIGPRETAGAEALFTGRHERRLVAAEELIAYLLPREVFLDVCRGNRGFEAYYFEDIAAKLENLEERRRGAELASFLMARIDEAYLHEPLFVDGGYSIHETAVAMHAHGSTAALVREGDALGIASVTGIHRAAVIERADLDGPVRDIAHFDLVSLPRDRSLFDAMLTMMKRGVSRIVVTDPAAGDGIHGVLEQRSLMSFFATHSHLVVTEIRRAETVDDLARASQRMIAMVRSLQAKGIKTRHIQGLVTELDGRLFQRLFELVAPPELVANACLVVMGSEGRCEQVLKTDQDNALILRDGHTHPDLDTVAERFSEGLGRLGYPPCRGGYMVSNRRWRQPLADYKTAIFDWIHHPDHQSLMDLSVIADARAVAGDATLLGELRAYLLRWLNDSPALLSNLARPVLAFDTPLGIFADFKLDKDEHPDELDIKKGGLFPLVHGVRSLALEARIEATSTLERIERLRETGLLDTRTARDLGDALDFMSGLRLAHMLEDIDAGRTPDNYVDPHRLGHLERDLLKDSLRVVNRFKRLVAHHFRLHAVT